MTKPIKAPSSVTLEEPIKRGETEITEVSLRRPNAGELRGLSISDVLNMAVDAHIRLLPRITLPSLTEHELSQMSPADFAQLTGEAASFLLPKAAKEAYQNA